MVPGINLGFNTTNDPGRGDVPGGTRRTQFPGRLGRQLDDARDALRAADRRVIAVTGQSRARPRHEQVRRRSRRAGARARSTCIPASCRTRGADADADADRWRALGRADAVHARPTTSCRRDDGGSSAASPASARRQVQPLQLPAQGVQPRQQDAGVPAADDGDARLQDRLEQLRAVRADRLAPERPGRLHARAARRPGAGDGSRRLLRRRTSGRGWTCSSTSTAPTRAARSA